MDDFALTPAERALFHALSDRGVRFLVIGLGAALLEGAPVSTQDLDIWLEHIDDPRISLAAADAGGFWVPGLGMRPPTFGGIGLDRLDVVLTAHGLRAFDAEYADAHEMQIEGVTLHILPLERIILSKQATNRPKDIAAIPSLEATLLARRASHDEP